MKTYCQVDQSGGRVIQMAAGFDEPPFEEAVEAPAEVLENSSQWRHEGGEWVFYAPVQIASLESVAEGVEFELVAILPIETKEVAVLFIIESGEPLSEPVTEGRASCLISFDLPGSYAVQVVAGKHGLAFAEVVVA